MSVKKTTGLVILIIGLVILFISATADLTRLGNLDGVVYKGFGYKQVSGIIVGMIIAVIGSILRFKKSKSK